MKSEFSHLRYTRLGFSSKRRHSRGQTPCSYCDKGSHRCCRERLDGTQCSCSCSIATERRADRALIAELDAERSCTVTIA